MDFRNYNPLVVLVFFLCNIVITMLTKNPIFILISFISSLVYMLLIKDIKKIKQKVIFVILVVFFATFSNPFFNQNGTTTFFKIGKINFTFEALAYGLFASLMLLAIIFWFSSYNEIMTNDKFLYLFSKYLPNIALIISHILKLIPEVMQKINSLNEIEKTFSYSYEKGLIGRLRGKFFLLGNIISYAIENAIITALAMKARGYGLKEKRNYTLYRLRLNDLILSFTFLFISIFIIIYSGANLLEFSFYPTISPIRFDFKAILTYVVYLSFSIYPTLNYLKEKIKWHYLNLKMYPSLMR